VKSENDDETLKFQIVDSQLTNWDMNPIHLLPYVFRRAESFNGNVRHDFSAPVKVAQRRFPVGELKEKIIEQILLQRLPAAHPESNAVQLFTSFLLFLHSHQLERRQQSPQEGGDYHNPRNLARMEFLNQQMGIRHSQLGENVDGVATEQGTKDFGHGVHKGERRFEATLLILRVWKGFPLPK